jgi:hypothetical protein
MSAPSYFHGKDIKTIYISTFHFLHGNLHLRLVPFIKLLKFYFPPFSSICPGIKCVDAYRIQHIDLSNAILVCFTQIARYVIPISARSALPGDYLFISFLIKFPRKQRGSAKMSRKPPSSIPWRSLQLHLSSMQRHCPTVKAYRTCTAG